MPAVGSSRNTSSGRPYDGAREGETLLLPAGQSPVGRPGRVGEAEDVHEPRRIQRVRGICRHQFQHLASARGRIAAAALQHHPDTLTQLGVVGDGIEPENPDAAGVRAQEALAHLDRRGLAGAVGPEQSQHLGVLDLQIETVDGSGRPISLGHAAQ
jgi:hypothetical protein